MDGNRWATVAGFVGALGVLAVLVWVVGVDRTLSALLRADPAALLAVVGIAVVWMTAWGLALWSVLNALGNPVAPATAVLVYTAAVFSNNVTPFGQAGGEPLSALLISSAADSEYETGLAAIATVDTVHFVPSIGYAIVGFTFVAAGAVRLGRNLVFAAVAVAVLAVGLPLAAYFGWRYRYELEATVVRVFTPVVRTLGRVVPRRSPPTAAAIEARIESFFAAIERIATDGRTVLQTLGLSAVGWGCLAASLWTSLYAIGYAVPVATVLLVVPLGSIASVAPLPGGSGAIETVLVTLLVSTAGVPAASAASAVLIHRGATYLLPTLVGAGVASALGANHAAASPGE
ncbi:lysylphosphatidylglycerol synthase transmembrane domain-containing protein [Haloarcula nitratireducens]|uniref:Flippase-like domain-containing protein n=1 Tax=Haloarcula nitratireducens TaxID=2487749 RepID=A0AAW4PEF1_9EURY|nr:lysylphosphatidylglycerol synthase transmembrane domain-containing protein [Halomicroarcula nitratireducens]MBX0296304.1 flippase-like domain-containing protein [Halomicroarcula nitratireducens]